MNHFAVIDVETTGLNPYRMDRVVEIAAMLISQDGSVVAEFASLVNPERDVGPTHLHGVTAGDVLHAPVFSQVAASVLDILRPAVAIVGHNVRFDISFLSLEYRRLGVELPQCRTVDTMQLSGGGTLAACCAAHGITLDGTAHSAECDAKATARLFFALTGGKHGLPEHLTGLPIVQWPILALPTSPPVRRDQARESQCHAPTYIQTLVSRLSGGTSHAAADGATLAYLDLLGRALEDRTMQEEEGQSLVEVALQWGLSFDNVKAIHGDYLRRLVKTACADGVVTTQEQEDIRLVARLLGFEEISQEQMGKLVNSVASDPKQQALSPSAGGSLQGQKVCFTGDSHCSLNGVPVSRETATSLAERHGMVVVDAVTKKLDILVVADPQTQSTKARKARQYGLRIIHEPDFWRLLGVTID